MLIPGFFANRILVVENWYKTGFWFYWPSYLTIWSKHSTLNKMCELIWSDIFMKFPWQKYKKIWISFAKDVQPNFVSRTEIWFLFNNPNDNWSCSRIITRKIPEHSMCKPTLKPRSSAMWMARSWTGMLVSTPCRQSTWCGTSMLLRA